MCLILFAINPNDEFSLVLAANRDELFARPTQTAAPWIDYPQVIAGRDDEMGGTWLGISKNGRFAAVTNFRETMDEPPPLSRGELTKDFLISDVNPDAYVDSLQSKQQSYKGFNLLVADAKDCFYFSNRTNEPPKKLKSGYYGLSNQLLDCDWPKVIEGKDKLKDILETPNDPTEPLFTLLTGSGDDRDFSNSFIVGDAYGTRAETVLLVRRNREVFFEERNFVEEGKPGVRASFQFKLAESR